MSFVLNSIKSRLLLGFAFLTLNVIFLSSMSYYNLKKIEKIRGVSKTTYHLHISTLKIIKKDMDLLGIHSKSPEFYQLERHPLLHDRDRLFDQIQQMTEAIAHEEYSNAFGQDQRLEDIQNELIAYNEVFRRVIQKVTARGFKDYGVEGKMRRLAHLIEKEYKDQVLPADLLMLRRHEKDYILRKESIYIQKLNNLCNEILKKLYEKTPDNMEAGQLLTGYRNLFNQLADLNKQIGLENKTGLKAELNEHHARLSDQFNELLEITEVRASEGIHEGSIIFGFTVLFSIIFSLTISYFIAQKFTKPIKKLSNTMDNFIVHKDLSEKMIMPQNSTYEIDSLANSFINLTKQIKSQFEEIEEKSSLLEKQNKDLSNLNRELDRFIYSVAHDLKSPLSSLKGLINLAKKDISRKEYQHYFDMMNGSITKLLSFISDIVNYTRNKRLDLEVEVVNLEEMVESIFNQYQFIEGRENIQKEVNIEQKSVFFSDVRRVQMVLTNIISNAVQYFDPVKKNPFIKVDILVDNKKAGIRIEDNGVGISEQHLKKVFDMFFRASEDSKGSGLGLFIVQETIKILEGKIEVSSVEFTGTTFTIDLPNHVHSFPVKSGDERTEKTKKTVLIDTEYNY
ncbi:HAMP domain-containing sensor histidine kinase [Fulvivirgaceae bacterium BMA12]|uniref:histidine kinase n=1 Tax=Agaribacillus aureus TaxID=3051825 RepID=A0ABT8L2A7_9BACT|nr:HAMP domain-containing sensor histidine kinase [Fulvivirgaceae bacterium BMA12]